MSKEKFISELKSKLKRLPKDEVENIVIYYSDYFDDAEKDESEVINELGSPSAVASQILADYAFDHTKEAKNKGYVNKLILIILAIFAAPIALPLAIAAVALIFAVILVIGAVFISFGAVILSLFIAGGAACIAGIGVIFQGPATGCFYIGSGLLIVGISLLCGIGIKNSAPGIFEYIKNISRKLLSKVNKGKIYKGGDK